MVVLGGVASKIPGAGSTEIRSIVAPGSLGEYTAR
jgi:hypothetical protein